MRKIGSGNWIVDNLNSALAAWNGKLAEIWTLLSARPEDFRGGGEDYKGREPRQNEEESALTERPGTARDFLSTKITALREEGGQALG